MMLLYCTLHTTKCKGVSCGMYKITSNIDGQGRAICYNTKHIFVPFDTFPPNLEGDGIRQINKMRDI